MGVHYELGTLLGPKKQLAYTRCARGQSILPLLGFASQAKCTMHEWRHFGMFLERLVWKNTELIILNDKNAEKRKECG